MLAWEKLLLARIRADFQQNVPAADCLQNVRAMFDNLGRAEARPVKNEPDDKKNIA
ncbi:hypothetical protein GB928_025695 [Shinella curvata]|uniref:Uncharacterized protein n=1 Tax=Shinella curvata TaxID=1817964 RepID=A0ABT8XLH2_9HYPH|nr:hypothetical protein [Shinella curvata]MCJ8056982.1 hypothetical protein [Shinella curvata]MDO6124586.1 hypothetical protein [Shinella curvata]